ncbi:hypothetical protein GA0115240_142178 [Streptomyces sp. DvalAA-14]|nr:hypothetical protein GA0115240_142178 [Streptomyces sp. DvalAA-14]
MPVGVHADRDQCVDVDDPAFLTDLLGQGVDPDERIRPGVQRAVAEGGDLFVQVLGHGADLRLAQLRDAEGLGEFLHPAGADAQEVGGGDHRDEGLFGPAAAFQEPGREVAALPQLGQGEFDGAGAGVPLARAVSVAVVDAFVADLPVFGVAQGVGLRRHERVGERLDHRAQQIRTRRSEVVLAQGVQGQTVRCGHRADLLRGFDTSKISRWPFVYAGTNPNAGANPRIRSNPLHHFQGRNPLPSHKVRVHAIRQPAQRSACAGGRAHIAPAHPGTWGVDGPAIEQRILDTWKPTRLPQPHRLTAGLEDMRPSSIDIGHDEAERQILTLEGGHRARSFSFSDDHHTTLWPFLWQSRSLDGPTRVVPGPARGVYTTAMTTLPSTTLALTPVATPATCWTGQCYVFVARRLRLLR